MKSGPAFAGWTAWPASSSARIVASVATVLPTGSGATEDEALHDGDSRSASRRSVSAATRSRTSPGDAGALGERQRAAHPDALLRLAAGVRRHRRVVALAETPGRSRRASARDRPRARPRPRRVVGDERGRRERESALSTPACRASAATVAIWVPPASVTGTPRSTATDHAGRPRRARVAHQPERVERVVGRVTSGDLAGGQPLVDDRSLGSKGFAGSDEETAGRSPSAVRTPSAVVVPPGDRLGDEEFAIVVGVDIVAVGRVRPTLHYLRHQSARRLEDRRGVRDGLRVARRRRARHPRRGPAPRRARRRDRGPASTPTNSNPTSSRTARVTTAGSDSPRG